MKIIREEVIGGSTYNIWKCESCHHEIAKIKGEY